MFWLAVKTGFFTILTLGFYRFWMKTRLRRWYWSSIRAGDDALEYVGDPLEKLMGFLVAVVILAFYIGVVNLILMFASFSLFQGNFAAYALSFLGVIPLWFYARYRARRYVLARTRWRGIRFGLEPGAWGYTWRALVHWGLTIVTLGILWPRMTFWLEKYRTDRMWFGSEKFVQGGKWTMLLRPMSMVYWAGGILLVAVVLTFVDGARPYAPILYVISIPWLPYALIRYRVKSLEIMANTKTIAGVGFVAKPRPGRVFRIYVFGYLLAGIAAGIFFSIIAFVAFAGFGDAMFDEFGLADPAGALGDLHRSVLIAMGIVSYFAGFLTWSVMQNTFVTMPLMRHYAETLTVTNATAIAAIRQRPRDEFAEAEGFAEALDVGAAI